MANKAYVRILILFLLSYFNSGSQTDSVHLQEVTVVSYLGERPVLRLPGSAAVIDSAVIARQQGQSLVPVLNTVPGVRMEERSPGSYRLSIRGSLVRSPFGVRNSKIYIDEFPLTNAGGDAYLNLLGFNSVKGIEVLKGPDGSLFGANSGGVVRIKTFDSRNNNPYVTIGAGAGSYGLFQQNIGVQQRIGKNTISVNECWLRSDGYRQQSAMDRRYVQLSDRISYSKNATLRLFLFYADLNYQTPGGLTKAQFDTDARLARPATITTPGAVGQNSSIRNRTLYAGVTHDVKITSRVQYVVSVFGSKTLFENPFITNYEVRNEDNIGGRTWLELTNKENKDVKLTWNVGGESQYLQSRISNYGNRMGNKDTVQAIDAMQVSQGFAFTRFVADLNNRWLIEASLSYNFNTLTFARQQPLAAEQTEKTFEPQLMPRLAASYIINQKFSLRAIVSRGYSPPTLQEIRPSDNTVNTTLKPENGWNYEAGVRLKTKNGLLWWDASVFYYQLNDAIVKQINAAGQDYFVNAGGTYQPGVESQVSLKLIRPRNEKFIRGLEVFNASTFNYFTFNNYGTETSDYSGNDLTGVPRYVSVTGLTVNFPSDVYLFAQYNYTDRIPLNDANSAYAGSYHLVQLKAGWKFIDTKKLSMDLCAGVDNLLDQKYSLGNDLNAFGGRYYNAAAPRNYFAKINVAF